MKKNGLRLEAMQFGLEAKELIFFLVWWGGGIALLDPQYKGSYGKFLIFMKKTYNFFSQNQKRSLKNHTSQNSSNGSICVIYKDQLNLSGEKESTSLKLQICLIENHLCAYK